MSFYNASYTMIALIRTHSMSIVRDIFWKTLRSNAIQTFIWTYVGNFALFKILLHTYSIKEWERKHRTVRSLSGRTRIHITLKPKKVSETKVGRKWEWEQIFQFIHLMPSLNHSVCTFIAYGAFLSLAFSKVSMEEHLTNGPLIMANGGVFILYK